MKWSNAALEEENRWYKEIKAIHKEIENEIASNLADLNVDENGVLDKKVSEKAILFNEKKIKVKFEEAVKKLITGTMENFGNRAMVEAEKASVKKGGEGSGFYGHAGRPGEVGGSGEGGSSSREGKGAKHGRTPTKWGEGTIFYQKAKGFCDADFNRLEKGIPEKVKNRPHTAEEAMYSVSGPIKVGEPEGVTELYVPVAKRIGLCYEMAARFIESNNDWKVTHATLYPRMGDYSGNVYFHAFAEKGNIVYDTIFDKYYDKKSYYDYYSITDARSFTYKETLNNMIKTKFWGAWD